MSQPGIAHERPHNGVTTATKRRHEQMMASTGRRTVPQIFIGDFHVGGCDDLMALDSQGRLSALLAA